MKALLARLLRFFEYLYYLRFPLLLWLVPFAAVIDFYKPSAFLHAVFTPQTWYQFSSIAFFTASTGVIALILARVICLNGPERFGPPAPPLLEKTLGLDSENWAAFALLVSQVPTIFLLVCVHANSAKEHVLLAHSHLDLLWMLFGLMVAAIFWYVVNLTYYATYPGALFQRPARTLLYPRFCFHRLDRMEQAQAPDSFTQRFLNWFFVKIACLGNGYGVPVGEHGAGQLYEGHRLAAIGLLGYLAVYALFFPLTAPATVPVLGWYILWIAIVFFAFLTLDQLPLLKVSGARLFFFIPLVAFLLCIGALVWAKKSGPPFEFFPVLGAVLILLTLLCFFFAGTAFFFDRFRLPVLAFALLLLLLPRIFIHNTGEHYFTAHSRRSTAALPTPSEIVSARCPATAPCNMIFVTATGGGIHAAVWTAGILAALEQDFQQAHLAQPFHRQLAFASTVSGGSVGFSDFLREYKRADAFSAPNQSRDQPVYVARIRDRAGCPGLEAVSWGLIYSDLARLVFAIPRSTPGWDRSNSLEAALERNATSSDCSTSRYPETPRTLDDYALTPETFASYPAFTMNTTAVEKGGRFLLANYQNDSRLMGAAPAASFEQVYNADLDLATAARLSATYPVVSSAARIVPEFSPHDNNPNHKGAAHFVDGGYYDNDGIVSAIEFLEDAFLNHPAASPQPAVNIYLIEIRDGYDLDTQTDEESFEQQAEYAAPLGLLGQAGAPLNAFWNTGHVGISRRNYLELIRLQQALNVNNVHLQFSALSFNEKAPLSWQLTPAQKNDILRRICSISGQRNQIVSWATQHQQPSSLPVSRKTP